MIGRGVDYTDAAIAQRLARDGEGEIIGYDFVDDDRRPYARSDDTTAAQIILAEGQATTLVILRTDANDPISVGKAIGYATKSPARITAILAPAANTGMGNIIAAAAQRFPDQLFIVAASENIAEPQSELTADSASNLLSVTAVTAEGRLAKSNGPVFTTADLAVTVDNIADGTQSTPSSLAVARTAALAARIAAVEPENSPAALKARILECAETWPAGSPVSSSGRWIKDARRLFWLE